jgi:hypothetical protein
MSPDYPYPPLKKKHITHVSFTPSALINPYPANVYKMVGSCQCWQMADGI